MYYTQCRPSPLGDLTLACDDSGSLAGLWIAGQKYFMASLPERPVPGTDQPVFARTWDWLDRYFSGRRPAQE